LKSKRVLYSIYIVVATLVFSYYLFPADAVKRYIIFNIDRASLDINVTIDQINPVFPPGLKLQTIRFDHISGLFLRAEQVNIFPKILSLFGPKTTFLFKGSAYKGSSEGRIDITKKKSAHQVTINAKLSGMQLKDISAIKTLTGREIKGLLEGSITLSNKKSGGTGNARLVVSDGNVELLMPVLNLETVAFSTLAANVSLDDRQFKIKQCTVKGDQIDARLSGSVVLKDPLGKSIVNLTGTLKPHKAFLAKLRQDLPEKFIPKKVFSKYGFSFRIRGTLDKPGFSLK